MKDSLSFSICFSSGQSLENTEQCIRQFLPDVQIMPVQWSDEYLELTNFATHRVGPDVSMVGNQSVGDLVAMNALQTFTSRDVAMMGGSAAFSPGVWKYNKLDSDGQSFEIPWSQDPRLIFYWKDMLEQAGVDEETAFVDAVSMDDSLARLKASGIETPWVLEAGNPQQVFQSAASWVWSAGGDFVNEAGDDSGLKDSKTLEGLRAYFRLHRYSPAEMHTYDWGQSIARFVDRRAAVILANGFHTGLTRDLDPALKPLLGVTLPPGPPYQGGSSLVLWKRTMRDELAKNFVRHLVSPEVQRAYCLEVGYLPTRLDTLAMPEFADNPNIAVYRKALEIGRPFTSVRASGMVQNTISSALAAVWRDISEREEQLSDEQLNETIEKRLAPAARRLHWVLGQF
jgi:multiple sugar transport system substrate-binding protein